MGRKNRPDRPVVRMELFSAPDPDPVAGCDVCAALTGQRAAARAIRDKSKVIDCNVEIRRHPHPKREGR